MDLQGPVPKYVVAAVLGLLAYFLANQASISVALGFSVAGVVFIVGLLDGWAIDEINKNRRRINDLEERLDKLEK